MKKLLVGLVAGLLTVASAHAAMEAKAFSVTPAGGGATNTAAYVIRGEIQAIRIQVATASTGSVQVTDAHGQTFFTKADMDTTATYPVRQLAVTSAGAAMVSNAVPFAAASLVTARVINHADTAKTNAYTITVIYRP